ncbi:MAG TPA: hypothetical protein VMD91_01660 [Candidatus Sulfotelmatobacter sp.]|nr:hypothetical protein [Candidatus Sulfotelmatobacter sp.]
MHFTILAAPSSDLREARARASAVVTVADPDALALAARAANDPYLLVVLPGAAPLGGAFGGVRAALDAGPAVLGGAAYSESWRHYGWMLGPSEAGALPFELWPIRIGHGEGGIEAQLRGPIDVPAPGAFFAERSLLLEPLPFDAVAALVEVAARARERGLEVSCLPSFAWAIPTESADDRGRRSALRAVSEAHPALVGGSRLPLAVRRRTIERETRFEGGLRRRVRMPMPPLTVLVHGPDARDAARRASALPAVVAASAVDEPVAALRRELGVRGERNVLIAASAALPDADALALLVERLEDATYVAAVAPSVAALEGNCVLLAAGRFPQHVQPGDGPLAASLHALFAGVEAAGRAVRAPGRAAGPRAGAGTKHVRCVFLASSSPDVLRTTLDAALAATRTGDELVAVCAAGNETARRILGANAIASIELDEVDPLLVGAANRALGAGPELTFLLSDDVLIPADTLDRLRAAFARVPALGAAVPSVPQTASLLSGEGVKEVSYGNLNELQHVAERRARDHARDCTPIELSATPAILIAREALDAVGGIDPALGPTRRGIADLVTRLRAAGYTVVRCDDTLVHRFDPGVSHNPAAAADLVQPLVAVPDRAGARARGFDPATRVPFVVPAVVATPARVAIVLAVADDAELERALAFVAEMAGTFDASDPVRLDLLLEGGIPTAVVAARVRALLVAGGKSLALALSVRVERVGDLAAWRAAVAPDERLIVAAGHERAAFAGAEVRAAKALDDVVRAAR